MRLLLTTLNSKYIHSNLAIRLLYGLNKEHAGIAWREFTIKEDKQDVAAACAKYEVVAFSCYIWNITQTLEVAELIKKLNPEVKILLGGPEVSYEWESVIALPHVDFIITGEGEIPIKEFIDQWPDIGNVRNLVSKSTNGIQYLPGSATFDVANYRDLLPYAFDDPATLKDRVLYIETSRGCPYKCEFCLASLDNKVRYLPMENIKANLLYMMQHGRVIKFLDRTFNVKKDFTLEIFRFILDNYRPGNVFQFEITADILHPDIIQFIHDHVPIGLFRFEIGIQTVNQKANLEVKRKQNFEKTKAIIRSVESKVELHLDLIVGLPFDYLQDIRYSFEEVFKLHAPELQLGFLKFLKGTPMRDKDQHGFLFDPNPPYQLIESKYLSKEELYQITLLEHALEIYWNKKRATHLLKYVASTYSSFDFLIGLGTYFAECSELHKYSLKDVYEIADRYIAGTFPQDPIMKQLLALDYYLQTKVKPQQFLMEDMQRSEKQKLIEDMKLNYHKFRFILLSLSFDLDEFIRSGTITLRKSIAVIKYDGVNKAVLETVIHPFVLS